jgi:hypothetical protein
MTKSNDDPPSPSDPADAASLTVGSLLLLELITRG